MFFHTRSSVFKNSKSSIDFHWFNGSSSQHSHSYYELFIIIKGEFTHSYMGKSVTLTKGDAVLIVPKHEHLLVAKTKHDLHANFSITEHAFKQLTKIYDEEFYYYLKETTGQPTRINNDNLSFLVNVLNSMYISTNPQSMDYFYQSLLHLILGFFIINKNSNPISPALPEWLKEFLEKLSSPQIFSLPLKEIYSMSNYSQSRFINLFKEYLNITPIEYITNLRIDHAKRLLAQTNYSLLSISNELGFSSYSHFVSLFKKRTGLTPSTYREHNYIPLKR